MRIFRVPLLDIPDPPPGAGTVYVACARPTRLSEVPSQSFAACSISSAHYGQCRMQGRPSRSRACKTCRRRRKGVSILFPVANRPTLTKARLADSATDNTRCASGASRRDSAVKGTRSTSSSTTPQPRIRAPGGGRWRARVCFAPPSIAQRCGVDICRLHGPVSTAPTASHSPIPGSSTSQPSTCKTPPCIPHLLPWLSLASDSTMGHLCSSGKATLHMLALSLEPACACPTEILCGMMRRWLA